MAEHGPSPWHSSVGDLMPAEVTFTVDKAGMNRLLHDPSGPYGQWLARIGLRMQNAARLKANVDTGLMRSRIEFRMAVEGGKLVGYLAAKTSYALYVHNGTRFYRGNPFLTEAVRETL